MLIPMNPAIASGDNLTSSIRLYVCAAAEAVSSFSPSGFLSNPRVI
jgi:hypothetical protein